MTTHPSPQELKAVAMTQDKGACDVSRKPVETPDEAFKVVSWASRSATENGLHGVAAELNLVGDYLTRPTPPPDDAELIADAEWLRRLARGTIDSALLVAEPKIRNRLETLANRLEALSQPGPDGDVPQLTAEEEAELVERINANPNLHPLPDRSSPQTGRSEP